LWHRIVRKNYIRQVFCFSEKDLFYESADVLISRANAIFGCIMPTAVMSTTTTARTVPAKRVLIVDDEPPVCVALKMVLVASGHTVEIAEDAPAALRAFEIGKHDLIITDYALGAMTGLHLAQAIRSRFPSQPIIMISAYAESLALGNDRLSNVNLLLGKPFSIKEINDALAVIFPIP